MSLVLHNFATFWEIQKGLIQKSSGTFQYNSPIEQQILCCIVLGNVFEDEEGIQQLNRKLNNTEIQFPFTIIELELSVTTTPALIILISESSIQIIPLLCGFSTKLM
jgi:hypothetical protein